MRRHRNLGCKCRPRCSVRLGLAFRLLLVLHLGLGRLFGEASVAPFDMIEDRRRGAKGGAGVPRFAVQVSEGIVVATAASLRGVKVELEARAMNDERTRRQLVLCFGGLEPSREEVFVLGVEPTDRGDHRAAGGRIGAVAPTELEVV